MDFQNLANRNAMYRDAEARALRDFLAHPEEDLALVPGHECRLARRGRAAGRGDDEPPLRPRSASRSPARRCRSRSPPPARQNFQEVNLGLAATLAATEATRCIACADPECVKGCPVGVKVREFVELVVRGDYKAAAAKMREDNVLPAVTGRVCPQEDQCEGACVMGKKFDPLAIGYLERFIADWEARVRRDRPPAPRAGHGQEGGLRGQRPGRPSPPPATSCRRATT